MRGNNGRVASPAAEHAAEQLAEVLRLRLLLAAEHERADVAEMKLAALMGLVDVLRDRLLEIEGDTLLE